MSDAVPDSAATAALYRTECAGCHGERGDGNGQADPALLPRPRDFTRGKFKLRASDPRKPISVEELFVTITNGIPGSAMPSYGYLSETQRRALAAFVRRFGIPDTIATGAPPIIVGKPPATTPRADRRRAQAVSRTSAAPLVTGPKDAATASRRER